MLPTVVRAAVVNGFGRVEHLVQAPLSRSPSRQTVEKLIMDVTSQCFTFRPVRGIGIACPGLVDVASGVVVDCLDLPVLNGFPLANLISGHGQAPAFVEHRARLQVMGDRWFGPGRNRRSFASVNTGETLGIGILYDGRVIAPHGGRTGAHMIVAANGGICTCGSHGCWKTVATSSWLRRRAKDLGLGRTHLTRLVELAAAGNQRAAELVDEYANNLALGMINIQHLFAPGLFIVHGQARLAGPDFLAKIGTQLRKVTSWDVEAERPNVVVAEIDEDISALLGGAGLVMSRMQ